MAAAGFLGFGKKEEILFPEHQPIKKKITWTQESLVTDHFHTTYLDDIMTIDADRAFAERVEKEGRRLKPPLDVYPLNDFICYRQKDERRLFDLVTDLERRLEEERKAAPPPPAPKPEKKAALSNAVANAEARQAGIVPDNPLTRATAEAEKHFGAAERVAAAQRGELPPRQPAPDYLERMGLAGQPATSAPTETENRWAEERLTEDLKEIQAEIEEADALVASTQELAPEGTSEKKQRRKRKSSGRTNQIMTRLTDSELTQFQRRVKKSGLAQGEYLRSVALTGKVVIEEHSVADVALLEELALIRAELGRQGGLLKMVIKPNEGQRQLAPAEWDELIQTVRDMEKMKKRLSDLEVKVQHGNSDPQNEQKRPVR